MRFRWVARESQTPVVGQRVTVLPLPMASLESNHDRDQDRHRGGSSLQRRTIGPGSVQQLVVKIPGFAFLVGAQARPFGLVAAELHAILGGTLGGRLPFTLLAILVEVDQFTHGTTVDRPLTTVMRPVRRRITCQTIGCYNRPKSARRKENAAIGRRT